VPASVVFPKLDIAPAYRHVAESVERMITSGALAPGDWLPTEIDLAAQLGVNRSTVREGLRALEHGGLVRRDGKRLRVTLPHYLELASRASRALVMHQVTFRELWEASQALETITAALAVERIGDEGIAALETNVAAMKARLADIDSVVALDIEFHDLLAECADNRAWSLAREPISLLFYPAVRRILARTGSQRRILDAHRNILALARRRDVDAVRTWMTKHMADFKRGWTRAGLDMDGAVDVGS